MIGPRVARIALAAAVYAIDRPFDYQIPAELGPRARPGVRVLVPFGAGNRLCDGMILGVSDQSEVESLKPILTVLDDEPVLDEGGIALALWMSRQYFCTVYDCIRIMLPAGALYALREVYRIADGTDREAAYAASGRSDSARQLVELLVSNPEGVSIEQIRTAFGSRDPAAAIRRLTDAGVLSVATNAVRNVADKVETIASLAMPPEEALSKLAGRRKSAPLRYAVVELLSVLGRAGTKELCYFTGASTPTIRSLAKGGYLTLETQEVFRTADVREVTLAGPIVLNPDQQAAFDRLETQRRSGQAGAVLLYGVTGSGKTLIYIRLIQQTIAEGRTAMVLVPEIALTPQLLRIFHSYFGDNVAILHSSLRATERYDEWKRVRGGKARVVIGTRSAVFAPLSDLGLLILDEEQEPTYKSEQSPRYHARDVARYRCAAEGALLILGSATPAVETMYRAREGTIHLVTLSKRYNEQAMPQVLIVDMKKELRAGNPGDISEELRTALSETILRGEQSILFLNRRGAGRMAVCGMCGVVPSCHRCSASLTYHSANNRLMCHYCGHSEPMPLICPECSGRLMVLGTGTQKVEESLKRLFPGVGILRMDTDTVSASRSHEQLLAQFEQEKIPILVGTQMVAKGLDFPNVTLVGVISADLSLYLDDFRAGERTFSLLTQVVGRAGRGNKLGRAVIQTMNPDHEVILHAAAQDYDSFYTQELHMRELRRCPPFSDLFVFAVSGASESDVLRTCRRLRLGLESALSKSPWADDWQLLGPAPAVIVKVNNRYRYRLTLTGRNSKEMRTLIAHILRAAQADKENRGVSIFADCNPID